MIDHDDEVPQADAELLARLGRHGRAQAAELDPRLMALAEGRLSPAEQAALAADAAADAELARAVEVFAPLDEAAQDRIADGVLAALGIARAGPVEEAPPAKVLPFRRRPVGRVLMAALPLAALPTISEAFISSTSRAILPVTEIDGRAVGNGRPGPITLRLMARLQQRLYAETTEMCPM